MRLLIAEDETEVRSALQILLKRQPEIDVAGVATTDQELLDQLKVLRPDTLLLDWSVINLDEKILASVHARYPALRIIVISGRSEVRSIALNAGADAFIDKSDPPDRLLAALQTERDESADAL
jgi:DNA-binding NarL/FixJ family response regulator